LSRRRQSGLGTWTLVMLGFDCVSQKLTDEVSGRVKPIFLGYCRMRLLVRNNVVIKRRGDKGRKSAGKFGC